MKHSVTDLATALRGAVPSLTPDEQRLVVGLYRELAKGAPVAPDALAEDLGLDPESVEEALRRWPGVFTDRDGGIIGFWDLALSGMAHELRLGDQTVTAWCALDPFLIVPLLADETATVTSTDPVTGEPVTVVFRNGEVQAEPETTVISMLAPEQPFDSDVVQSFCHYVHFFASPESGEEWTKRHSGAFLLDVDTAHAVARRSWPTVVADALGAEAPQALAPTPRCHC